MKAIAFLFGTILAVVGCSSVDPHLVPTPAVLKDPRVDFASRIPEALRTPSQPVFFATTRAPAAEGHYGDADGGGVMLGVATVRLGEPGMSWDQLVASHRNSSVDRPRSGAVEAIEELGRASRMGNVEEAERRFIAAIDSQIERSRNRELIIYVHGYRVAFDEVAVQMASFSHYLGQGAALTFQWPTGAMFWNYLTDCPRAESYIPDIERLLVLAGRTKADYINVMAYSCGSPLLAAAVARLRQRDPLLGHDELQRKYRLGSVIFAASDVDLKTFARDYVAPALDVSQQVVIYFSQVDRALGFSTLVAGASRLGRPDLTVLSVEDLQRMDNPRLVAVDVTQVGGAHEMGGMKGHGYWYANEVISSDVSLSLRYPIPPARRCLENQPRGSRVWRIPEGYVDCVTTRLLEAFPELRSKPALAPP
ncbi:alpha/beta hydrolase [Variovorax saccharolyticus]|uniref:alpha/beta hydrolase n=1 Tax=Variovorax saccharolyticus TaxID=3053516 RepID=UPI0025787DEE|nr:alpha/beta hydrolase [Variovorax sp. J22R187]MDM0022529.1 alpha/beta hydrolase [Variovorax sp. J22R187]